MSRTAPSAPALWRIRLPGTRALQLVLGFLFLAHFVQIFSPMRLDMDATSYLSRTISIVDGEPLGPMWLPPGFSYMLAGLELLGIGNAWTFAGLSWLFVLLGILASLYVLRRELGLSEDASLVVACMTLLSFVFVKYMPIPLGDTAYFGLSMSVLALLSRVGQGSTHAVRILAAAVVLAFVAIATRTIGVTLVAALIGVAWSQRTRWADLRKRPVRENLPALASISLGLLFVAGTAGLFLTSRYLEETAKVGAARGAIGMLEKTLEARLLNWGELFLNAPHSVTPDPVEFLYVPAALIAFGVVLFGFWRNRDRWGPTGAYFAAYLLALLIYPGPQTRYWLPVLPLIIGWGILGTAGLPSVRIRDFAIAAYLCLYVIAGCGALTHSTRISLSEHRAATEYGDVRIQAAYRAAYGIESAVEPDSLGTFQRRVFYLLRRYDPRAREP